MVRDLLSAPLVFGASAAVVAAYLWGFHQNVPLKEVLSTAAAMTLGVFAGRAWERKKSNG